ncbi:hypothetical protein SUDANB150_00835 [Streptomyces sp. enrichment culture]
MHEVATDQAFDARGRGGTTTASVTVRRRSR